MVKKAAQATPNHLLRAARKERNWTQKEVADHIGAPQSFNISRWEQGTAFPSAHYIQQLCLLFGKSAKELGLLVEEPIASSEPSTKADSPSLWNVPYRRNPFFTGREEVLTQLHERLTASGTAALTQTQAISGLGGIGKTQIAIEYAYRHREDYRAIFWVRAASRETLLSDFVALARLLELPGRDVQEQQLIVEAVKRWLAQRKGWLLILDNADDLTLTSEFLPTGGRGNVLLTTRAQATGTLAFGIVVEKLEQEKAMWLLLRRASILALEAPLDAAPVAERAIAQSIAMVLDGLPLALDQAGAYIEETGCSLSEYLGLYRQHRRDLLSRRSSVAPDYPSSVMRTWSLSFEQIEQANPAAADLLRLCAFLDPDAIPEAIITAGASALPSPLGSAAADPFTLNGVIEAISKYSLIRRNPDTKMLMIHRLVQAVLRDNMNEQTQQQWAERSVRAVAAAFPVVDFVNWQQCQECLPHVQACAEYIERYSFTFPEAARLLTQAGNYLLERGYFERAELLLQRALLLKEQALGPEHPDTAITLNHLAFTCYSQGQYAQARSLYQRALTIREQTLGPEHPDTADTLNNLARLYLDQGQYPQAEPLLQRALAIFEQIPEHPETAHTLNNLAGLYWFQGQYAKAEPIYQRALAIFERVQGPGHPHTGTTLNNLARLYLDQDRYVEAESLFQRALVISKEARGPEHPETANTLDNLGTLYRNQGRYAQAEPLQQHALYIHEQTLGPEHPETAITLVNLAHLYDFQVQYAQAEPLYQRALAIFEKAFGFEHPRIATILTHLAHLYENQGRQEQARTLYQQALAIREKVLGPEHPDTIKVRESYTYLLEEMEHSTEVAKMEGPE